MKYILTLFALLPVLTHCAQTDNTTSNIQQAEIQAAEKLFGLHFTDAERDLMLPDVQEQLESYEAMREISIPNSTPMALDFNPIPPGVTFDEAQQAIDWQLPQNVEVPKNKAELAFYSVAELASLIKARKITSLELTQLYLDRLKRYGDTLQCVVSITEEIALAQAKRADAELAAGKYRGPLHGIPYGAKDLLSVAGTKTTWGATPYQNQVIDETATVIQKLEEAGAVLVAKLTLGALAWGDVWFGGTTKNPWNLEQGSSGSSAGSASATVAGLVAFSIGTETLGSIVSPSTRCGATGLRPTYGRVSRVGAMALSWSMDKIGPICRSAEDCALVFDAIIGTDGKDQALVDVAFNYEANRPLSELRIGYLKDLFENDYFNKQNDSLSLAVLRKAGAKLEAVSLPDEIPVGALRPILSVEAAAAFDELTRSNLDSTLVRQVRFAWPNVFRAARLVPAVEYVQANRLRYLLIQQMHEVMQDFDVIVCPSFGGTQLLATNLTGHPCLVVPNGYQDVEGGFPASISFIANLYEEASLISVGKAYQEATDFEDRVPKLFIE
jgi:Asp-tRNA(Asn)/Glu-tRNA(Gln) amidotransferase A subunit family amidase